jgi:hypothetical protein
MISETLILKLLGTWEQKGTFWILRSLALFPELANGNFPSISDWKLDGNSEFTKIEFRRDIAICKNRKLSGNQIRAKYLKSIFLKLKIKGF